jgi:MFS family permease
LSPPAPTPRHDPYAAIRHANYRFFAAGFLCSSFGLQMMNLALLWEIYERTGDAFMLGLMGLARALPVVITALPAGQIIDGFRRTRVLVITQAGFALAAALLAFASHAEASPMVILGVVSLAGFIRTFNGPVRSSLLPDIVPRDVFPNAVTWNSGVFQFSAALGPLLGGAMVAWLGVAWPVYLCTSVLCGIFAVLAMFVKPVRELPLAPITLRTMLPGMGEGLRHVWRDKLILSVITLDLFAVLLGGATALLPVYAKDILHVGPVGLGWLRAASFIGAFAMAVAIAHLPPMRRAGPMLLASVATFGVCMIIFGLTTWFWIALGALLVAGAVDNISVVIRHVLVQERTPPHVRGRVSAVNSVFIECSNELGSFESGLIARLFGPVVSVVSGGIGTILVVAAVALAWPQVRKLDALSQRDTTPEE